MPAKTFGRPILENSYYANADPFAVVAVKSLLQGLLVEREVLAPLVMLMLSRLLFTSLAITRGIA